MSSVSLIIAVYKNIPFLELVLQSVNQQSFRDFEVIIAEDNNSSEMKNFIDDKITNSKFKISHFSQEDKGFRKNKILNEAVRNAKTDKLVFIDGDCLIHKHFLKNYDIGITNGIVRAGRRIELSKKHTEKLINRKEFKRFSIIELISNKVKYPEKTLYLPAVKFLNSGQKHLLGCNWGIMKSDLEQINGFDEDYEKAGVGEDSDVEWRLLAAGIQIQAITHSALQYHLYHDSHYGQSTLNENLNLMKKKMSLGNYFCDKGLK